MKRFKNYTEILKTSSKDLLQYRKTLRLYHSELLNHIKEYSLTCKLVNKELKHKTNNLQEELNRLEDQRLHFDPEASFADLEEHLKNLNIH